VSHRFDDLSQRVLEGEATAGERERLATLIARDPSLRARHEELERALKLLAEARPEEPSAGIRDAVLREIAALDPARVASPRRTRPSLRSRWLRFAAAFHFGSNTTAHPNPEIRFMAKIRSSLVAGGVVLAAAIGFLAWKGMLGYPPQNTQGTIGAAKRYQAAQIADSDVELSDPQTQAFIQSDLFHRIRTDSDFRKAVLSGGLERVVVAQMHAIDIARAALDVGKSVSPDVAAKATELAQRADALAAVKDFGKLADAERSVIDLAKAADEFAKFVEGNKTVDAGKLAELERTLEALARFSDATRSYLTTQRAADVAEQARTLMRMNMKSVTPEQARMYTKNAEDVAKQADALAQWKDTGRNVAYEKAATDLAKAATELSRNIEVAKLVDVDRLTVLQRTVDAFARTNDAARTSIGTGRAAEVAAQARELEKTAEAAHLVTTARQAGDVAKMAEALATQKDAGRTVESAKAVTDLANAARELAKSVEQSKLTDAAATARELEKSIDAYARVTDAGLKLDAAEKFVEMARMVDTGKLATGGN